MAGSGIFLLLLGLALESVFLVWLVADVRMRARIPDRLRLPLPPSACASSPLRPARGAWALASIVALGAALRLMELDGDLWLDEVVTLNLSREPVSRLLTTFPAANHHLLHTLAAKGSRALFGEAEWALRVPAVLFGIATIPVIHALARLVASRLEGLAAALLLATSYHHIFFSQNARGYTAYLFFSLLATRFFVDALREDRARSWILYAAAIVLDAAFLLHGVFVWAAHAMAGGAAAAMAARGGRPAGPLIRRLVIVFGMSGCLILQSYALMIPQMIGYLEATYSSPDTGFAPFSWEALAELHRLVTSGFGAAGWLGAALFAAVTGVGLAALLRRSWVLGFSLLVPGLLTLGVVVAQNLTLVPRMFLLWLPLAILAAVLGVFATCRRLAHALGRSPRSAVRVAGATCMTAAVLFLTALPRYYARPMQDYRGPIGYVESQRRSGDAVIVVGVAELGVRHYSAPHGVREGAEYFYVRSPERFDAVLEQVERGRIYLISTFSRALRLGSPALLDRMQRGWKVTARYPGTVGDGEVLVWEPKEAAMSGGVPRR